MKEMLVLALLGFAFFLATKADGSRRFRPAERLAQRR